MKNFRLLLAAAVVFAVGSAFTNAPEKNNVDDIWYLPVGNINPDTAAALNFNNYDPNSAHSTPTGCNSTRTKVCAAKFPDTSLPAEEVRTKN